VEPIYLTLALNLVLSRRLRISDLGPLEQKAVAPHGTMEVPMPFIPPMLREILRDPARLDDRRYVAEPKFDGQRAQIHVAGGRTVAAFSRRKQDLLRHAGCAWLREVCWPVGQAVLDGELCGETGSDGIQSVLEARGRRDGVTSFLAFDLLQLAGQDMMPGPPPASRTRSGPPRTRASGSRCPERSPRPAVDTRGHEDNRQSDRQ
jgi:ATP-dependent DNA ligase